MSSNASKRYSTAHEAILIIRGYNNARDPPPIRKCRDMMWWYRAKSTQCADYKHKSEETEQNRQRRAFPCHAMPSFD